MTSAATIAIRLMKSSAAKHRCTLAEQGNSLSLPGGGTATAHHDAALISDGRSVRRFSTSDSLDLALFAVKMDEALAAVQGDRAAQDGSRLLGALWAVERIAGRSGDATGWREITTQAGMIAAAWDVGLVKPKAPAFNVTTLRMGTLPAIERFRRNLKIYAFTDRELHASLIAVRATNGAVVLWSPPNPSGNFLEVFKQFPG